MPLGRPNISSFPESYHVPGPGSDYVMCIILSVLHHIPLVTPTLPIRWNLGLEKSSDLVKVICLTVTEPPIQNSDLLDVKVCALRYSSCWELRKELSYFFFFCFHIFSSLSGLAICLRVTSLCLWVVFLNVEPWHLLTWLPCKNLRQ